MKNPMLKLTMLHAKKASMAAMLALALFTTGCKKDDDDTTPTPTPTPTYGKLMAIHASPDAPGVDLLIDNTVQNSTALTYPNNTSYLQVQTGTRNVKINATGTSTSVINANLTIEENKNYSVFAVDSLSNIQALVITDDLTAPASGKAHVRFVHLSPNAPAVDVAVVGSTTPLFSNYSFKQYSSFTPLAASTYNLEVRVAGTTTVALNVPGVSLAAGKIYTIFAKGFLGGTGSQALGAQVITNN